MNPLYSGFRRVCTPTPPRTGLCSISSLTTGLHTISSLRTCLHPIPSQDSSTLHSLQGQVYTPSLSGQVYTPSPPRTGLHSIPSRNRSALHLKDQSILHPLSGEVYTPSPSKDRSTLQPLPGQLYSISFQGLVYTPSPPRSGLHSPQGMLCVLWRMLQCPGVWKAQALQTARDYGTGPQTEGLMVSSVRVRRRCPPWDTCHIHADLRGEVSKDRGPN